MKRLLLLVLAALAAGCGSPATCVERDSITNIENCDLNYCMVKVTSGAVVYQGHLGVAPRVGDSVCVRTDK
jgi:hypothetical protein